MVVPASDSLVIDESTAPLASDPTALLDDVVLPLGVSSANLDHIAMPIDDKQKPLNLLALVSELADAGLKLDRRFMPELLKADAEKELRTFEARCLVDGIRIVPESALGEKRAQIEEQQKAETLATSRRFQQLAAAFGRRLYEERAEAIRVRSHAEEMPGQALVAHQTDLLEEHLLESKLERITLPELVELYARTPDASNRALVRFVESGRRPARSDDGDAVAAVRLARLVRERQAARIPAELRERFQQFKSLTEGGSRGTKIVLVTQRSAK